MNGSVEDSYQVKEFRLRKVFPVTGGVRAVEVSQWYLIDVYFPSSPLTITSSTTDYPRFRTESEGFGHTSPPRERVPLGGLIYKCPNMDEKCLHLTLPRL